MSKIFEQMIFLCQLYNHPDLPMHDPRVTECFDKITVCISKWRKEKNDMNFYLCVDEASKK